MSFSSCDYIDEPYMEDVDIDSTNRKKVLLEDYTGHRCVNCPSAASTAHMLKEQFGDNLIIMAVHAGYYSEPEGAPYNYDFRTQAGDAFDHGDYFNISMNGNPNGTVNRIKNGTGGYHIKPGDWGINIVEQLALPQLAEIIITNNYVASTRTLNVKIDSEFLLDANGVYKLGVYLIEDSIIKPQKNNEPSNGPVPDIMDYAHMHVLRGAINDTWGEQIPNTPINTIATKNYSYVLDNEFDENHCHVIAFIYRDDDADGTKYEIVQADEKKIIL